MSQFLNESPKNNGMLKIYDKTLSAFKMLNHFTHTR